MRYLRVERAEHGSIPFSASRFYSQDWHGTLPSTPRAVRRALDAPLAAPPYPSSDWGYGGSPAIDVPDGTVYPLMTALKFESSRTKIYGRIAPSLIFNPPIDVAILGYSSARIESIRALLIKTTGNDDKKQNRECTN